MKKIVYIISIGILISCGNSKKSQVVERAAEPAVAAEDVKEATKPATIQRMPQAGGVSEEAEISANEKAVFTIEWLDFETAIERNKKEPKFIFIDIYTEWCGWCKKMDASTFVNPEVVTYINKHCYAVKMDAESKESIAYKDHLYEFKQYNSKSGYNTLSVSLLDSKMSFPSFVILNKKEVKKGKIMGYKDARNFLLEMNKYIK